MDATALSLCMENDLPIHVFNVERRAQHRAHRAGARIGTVVSSGAPRAAAAAARAARRDDDDDDLATAPARGATPRGITSRDRRRGRGRAAPHGQDDRVDPPRVRLACAPAAPRPALLDRIQVSYYGTKTPLNQLAQISVPEPRLLSITPYDKSAIKEIERAILESDLGLTPANDGQLIRLPIPQLTEQRRKELVKVVGKLAEEGRIAVRNVRRDAITHLKELEKKGEVGIGRAAPRRGAGAEADRRAREADRRRCTSTRKPRSSRSRPSPISPRVPGLKDRIRAARPPAARRGAAPARGRVERSRSSWTATAAGRADAACP